MMKTAGAYNDGPCAVRFPRGEGRGVAMPDKAEPLAIGKGRILQKGSDIAILSLGTILEEAEKAANILSQQGVSVTVADARFAKPIDTELLDQLVADHKALLIVEESSPGGFSAHAMQYLANAGLCNRECEIRIAAMADAYIDHAGRADQLKMAGIDADALVELASQILPSTQKTAKNKS